MKDTGSYWEVPAEAYPRLEQGAVVLKTAKDQAAAQAFFEYIKGADGAAVLKRYGFSVPAASSSGAPWSGFFPPTI